MGTAEKGIFLGEMGGDPVVITEISFFMALLWCSIWMILIYFVRRKWKNVGLNEIACIVMLYIFCALRLALPLDFYFTRSISFRGGIYAGVYEVLCLNEYFIAGVTFHILDILVVVWASVAVILILRFLFQYHKAWKMFACLEKREDTQCRKILEKIARDTGKRRDIEVCIYSGTEVPRGIGIRKRRILLPNREYDDTQLYYILLHEYTHFLNGDLMVKFLIHIFCCFFGGIH